MSITAYYPPLGVPLTLLLPALLINDANPPSSYTSMPNSPLNTRLPVWQTEYADLQGAWTSAWYSNNGAGEGLRWANYIYDAIVRANASAYLYWVGVQGGPTNSKMVRISDDKRTVTPSKRLWAMANWSRFVRPGAVRVGTSGGPSGAKVSAFRNVDGTVSVQVIQGGTASGNVNVRVSGGATAFAAKSVKAWVTDNTRDVGEVPSSLAADGSASANVPGRSMVTFVLDPNE
jgi:O-glycosyl hydrolase